MGAPQSWIEQAGIKNPANNGPGLEDGGYITFVRQV